MRFIFLKDDNLIGGDVDKIDKYGFAGENDFGKLKKMPKERKLDLDIQSRNHKKISEVEIKIDQANLNKKMEDEEKDSHR